MNSAEYGMVEAAGLIGCRGWWALAFVAAVPSLMVGQLPVRDVRYEVRFDARTAATQTLEVGMTFAVDGNGPILLSLPIWTPGAYEVSNFAHNVSAFSVQGDGRDLWWDKLDFDTWRIQPDGVAQVTVRFDYRADSLDNAMAWAQNDFVFFTGTNLLLFPDGMGYDFPARLTVHTEPDWRVATGMTGGPREFSAESYHGLVDMPVFVGRFDVDSQQLDGTWNRLATYPEGALQGADRAIFWTHLGRIVPAQAAVFGETPWDDYTTLIVFAPAYGGGSALEHGNSHIGIYNNQFIGDPVLPLITAHEVFHAWNVKRLRPVDMVPYEYDRAQPTTLLWVSEGITDYYADLTLARGTLYGDEIFYILTGQKINEVRLAPQTALEDASLTAWIGAVDGTESIYYPKGSLAGLMLDILIRDHTNNQASLDDVMRRMYETTYKQGEGFTTERWWAVVREIANGRDFQDFHDRYVDGRERFPWNEILPLAGMRLLVDSTTAPFLGVGTESDETGVRVTTLTAGGAALQSGVRPGDVLVQVGEVDVAGQQWSQTFRERYTTEPEGSFLDVVIRRDGQDLRLSTELRFRTSYQYGVTEDRRAGFKALRIREGILRGEVGSPGRQP